MPEYAISSAVKLYLLLYSLQVAYKLFDVILKQKAVITALTALFAHENNMWEEKKHALKINFFFFQTNSKQPVIHLQNTCFFDCLVLFECILFLCNAVAWNIAAESHMSTFLKE